MQNPGVLFNKVRQNQMNAWGSKANVPRVMKEQGYSQTEAAVSLGITAQMLGQWINTRIWGRVLPFAFSILR